MPAEELLEQLRLIPTKTLDISINVITNYIYIYIFHYNKTDRIAPNRKKTIATEPKQCR